MRLTVLLVFLLVVVWAPLPHSATQRTAEFGRISGLVFRLDTGDPIRDVSVTVTFVAPASAAPAANPGAAAGATPAQPAQTTTRYALAGRDGRFVVDGLTPGDYNIRAQLEGYFSGDDTGGGAPNIQTYARATVLAGQTGEVRLAMILGGTISGRVQMSNGRLATNTQVSPFRLGYQPDGVPVLQQLAARMSDDHGEFRLYQLPPGTYYVVAFPNGSGNPSLAAALGRGATGAIAPQEVPVPTLYPEGLHIPEARPLTLASGEEIEGVNIAIRNARYVRVTGRVFSNLPESAYAANATPPRGANPQGEANSAAIQAALEALERLRAQRGQSGTEATVAATPVAATPLPTVQLQLVPRDRRALLDPGMSRTLSAALAPPNDGRFTLEDVRPGSYVLYASLPDNGAAGTEKPAGTAGIGRAFGRANLDVESTDVSEITITIHRGADVTGLVYSDVELSELPGMRVSVQADDSAARVGQYQQVGNTGGQVRADGAFTIPFVPEAAYRIQVNFGSEAASRNAFVLAVRQDGADLSDSAFAVGDGPVAPIEIFVSVKSGSITGTALDANGRPVPKSVVALIPPPERRHNPAFNRMATADAEGKFTLTGVPPGEFRILALGSIISGAHKNEAFMARYENSGIPVTVEAGGEVRADPPLVK